MLYHHLIPIIFIFTFFISITSFLHVSVTVSFLYIIFYIHNISIIFFLYIFVLMSLLYMWRSFFLHSYVAFISSIYFLHSHVTILSLFYIPMSLFLSYIFFFPFLCHHFMSLPFLNIPFIVISLISMLLSFFFTFLSPSFLSFVFHTMSPTHFYHPFYIPLISQFILLSFLQIFLLFNCYLPMQQFHFLSSRF